MIIIGTDTEGPVRTAEYFLQKWLNVKVEGGSFAWSYMSYI